MARSTKRSITVPHPVSDALKSQLNNGTLDYPSENAAWIGLARYQLIIGKPHPVTAAIARMHTDDQDVIDDYLLFISEQGESLRGSFFRRVMERALANEEEPPTDQDGGEAFARELLKMAKSWKASA